MPPRKSNASMVSTTADETSMLTDAGADSKSGDASKAAARKKKEDTVPTSAEQTQLGIDEFMMPRMMTVRLAKGVLPPHTLIHRDAATALQYAASVFLNHVAAAANEHTLGAQRKNISPQDMLAGLRDTEWGALVPQLEDELAIYVRTINDKRNEYRRKLKERGSLGTAGSAGVAADAADVGDAATGDTASGAGAAVSRGPDSQLLGEDSMMSRIMAGEDEEEEEDEETGARTGTPATDRRDGPDGPRAKKARLGEGVKQVADDDEDEDMIDEEEEEEEEEEEDEGDDEEEEDDEQEGEGGDDEEEGDEEVDEELDRTSNRDEDEDEEGSDEESD